MATQQPAGIKDALNEISDSLNNAMTAISTASLWVSKGPDQIAENGQLLADGTSWPSKKAGVIIQTIEEIAEQINMLSMNAAIEAAVRKTNTLIEHTLQAV